MSCSYYCRQEDEGEPEGSTYAPHRIANLSSVFLRSHRRSSLRVSRPPTTAFAQLRQPANARPTAPITIAVAAAHSAALTAP